MNRSFYKYLLLILLAVFTGCTKTNSESGKTRHRVKNIIIFIGDGMGVPQLYAGMTVNGTPFNLEKFPYSGLSKTYSADNYITDSAAGGTAIACGEKTNNGMIGVKPDNTVVSSITEIAHKNGLATGVVSTSAVTHATPASFVAHNSGRGNYEEIADDFLKGTLDVFIGGGENHFRNRKDSADLAVKLKEQGFDVLYNIEDLIKSQSLKLAGLLAKEHMPKVSDGRQGVLSEMTRKAIETLSKNKNGFVLMVEGSMIDWGAHENNIDYAIEEMIDLDQAIGTAYDFATEDGSTLIVVTADHETGGLVLTGGNIPARIVQAKFAGMDHSAVMVPIFSYGPGAEIFSGIHENTFFFNEFIQLLGLKKD
ncbi:MAG TPA: alkaline phosphatase [Bacteroidales bacterium]|nr:alkaline phosphatase [Bacteroidales bacterium]